MKSAPWGQFALKTTVQTHQDGIALYSPFGRLHPICKIKDLWGHGKSNLGLLSCIRSTGQEPDTCSPPSDTLARQTHAPLKITPLCSDMFSSQGPGFRMCLCLSQWAGEDLRLLRRNELPEDRLAQWSLRATTQHFSRLLRPSSHQ